MTSIGALDEPIPKIVPLDPTVNDRLTHQQLLPTKKATLSFFGAETTNSRTRKGSARAGMGNAAFNGRPPSGKKGRRNAAIATPY
jgi:hypothetical protein